MAASLQHGWPEMSLIELPSLRSCEWDCELVERVEVAGTPIWVATIKVGDGRPPLHRWCLDYYQALAFATEQVNKHGFPLFDFAQTEDAC